MYNSSTNESVNVNSTLLLGCLEAKTFSSSSEFFACYSLLYRYNWEEATAEIILAIATVLLNALVIFILVKRPNKNNIFEKLLIAHCIVDGMTGLLAIPFFHITEIFGYWPFGDSAAVIWTSYDSAINVITNLHMLYMSWLRFRSIRAPKTYQKEIIARKPELMCFAFWLIGFLVWVPVLVFYGLEDYSVDINYKNKIVGTLLIFFSWCFPLAIIIALSISILVTLRRTIRKKVMLKHELSNNSHSANSIHSKTESTNTLKTPIRMRMKKLFNLGPQIRFQIIIGSYCLQWLPSCLLAIIDPLFHCVPMYVIDAIYWLTYTVCFTDPLVILFLNPNVSIRSASRISPH